jgi:serine protease Do
MRLYSAIAALLAISSIYSCAQDRFLTQKQACSNFSNAVVAIKAGPGPQYSIGSGFLVSSDGYMLTAMHVVRNGSNGYFSPIEIDFLDGSTKQAQAITQLGPDSVIKDYALLKIDNNGAPLPFLKLGSFKDVAIGADATFIGFPFNAASEGAIFTQKLCLSATFAGADTERISYSRTQHTGLGDIPLNGDIQIDVIYFQGPSIKGVSGSPIISRDNGKVVGIVSTKLSGIGKALDAARNRIGTTKSEIYVNGVATLQTTGAIINMLDDQLANGLGAAVGIDSARKDLEQTQK